MELLIKKFGIEMSIGQNKRSIYLILLHILSLVTYLFPFLLPHRYICDHRIRRMRRIA